MRACTERIGWASLIGWHHSGALLSFLKTLLGLRATWASSSSPDYLILCQCQFYCLPLWCCAKTVLPRQNSEECNSTYGSRGLEFMMAEWRPCGRNTWELTSQTTRQRMHTRKNGSVLEPENLSPVIGILQQGLTSFGKSQTLAPIGGTFSYISLWGPFLLRALEL